MQQCIEAMLEDEREGLSNGQTGNGCTPWDPSSSTNSLAQNVDSLSINDDLAKDVRSGWSCFEIYGIIFSQSKLNPEATEFVPRQREATPVESKA